MGISNENIFLIKEDLPLSRIAKFFRPQDNRTKEFLASGQWSPSRSYEGHLVREEILKKSVTIAICTAPKGETLRGVLKAISTDGWDYATLGGWYRYHTKFPFRKGEIIVTPGTTYLDEDYREWIPFVSSQEDISFFQKIIRRRNEIVAEIILRPMSDLTRFQSEKRILVSRTIKEEKIS